MFENINKENISQFMIQPVKCMSTTKNFTKSTMKYLKVVVTDIICNGEIELEVRKSRKISGIIQVYELWFKFVNHYCLGNA